MPRTRFTTSLAFAFALGAVASERAGAFDADRDPTFSDDGLARVAFDLGDPYSDRAVAMFEGTDGAGTWVIGEVTPHAADPTPTGLTLGIARLNASGGQIFRRTLDTGIAGIRAAAPAPGGGAVVFGFGPGAVAGTSDIVIVKLSAGGALDLSFTGDGIHRLGLAGPAAAQWRVDGTVEPDGTIDVAYQVNSSQAPATRALRRLHATSGATISTYTIDTADDIFNNAIVTVQPDGRLLLFVGRPATPQVATCALQVVRFQTQATAGSLTFDPSFDSSRIPLAPGDCDTSLLDARVDADGRILVALNAVGQEVLRLQPDGRLDATFNPGRTKIAFTTLAVYAIGVQSDGSVIAAGEVQDGAVRQTAVCRLGPQGSLDSTFAGGTPCARFRFPATGGTESTFGQARDIAITSGGRILLGGSTKWADPQDFDFAVARLTGGGRLFANDFE